MDGLVLNIELKTPDSAHYANPQKKSRETHSVWQSISVRPPAPIRDFDRPATRVRLNFARILTKPLM